MRIAIGVLLAAAVILLVAQLILPGIAERTARERISEYGEVEDVNVSAVPAIELLWGKADSVEVSARHISIAPRAIAKGLVEARSVGKLAFHAARVDLADGFGGGHVELAKAALSQDGEVVHASAVLTQHALSAALPAGVQATIVPRSGRLEVLASGQLFGFTASVTALVHASEGQLLLTPTRPLIARLAQLTLFSDPRLRVLHVSAAPESGSPSTGPDQAWVISGEAVLR